MAALAKGDKTLRLRSECFKAGVYDAQDTGVKGGNVQAVLTPTSSFQFPKSEASASPSSTAMGAINSSTSSKPKKAIKSTVPPPISAEVDDWQLEGEGIGWFIDPFPSNTYISSLDYSICDKDCGWCGTCMDNVSLEYVLLFLH